jgi:hypothetical protein
LKLTTLLTYCRHRQRPTMLLVNNETCEKVSWVENLHIAYGRRTSMLEVGFIWKKDKVL